MSFQNKEDIITKHNKEKSFLENAQDPSFRKLQNSSHIFLAVLQFS